MAERISCEDYRTEGDSVETNLKGKTVLVTDALHNFGTPMALAFAREGANLFLTTLSDIRNSNILPVPCQPWASRP